MTTWLPRSAAAAVGAALLLAAAGAYAQLPTAEQRAFTAVDNAISVFENASGRDEVTRAAGQIVDAAERALNAFTAADSARAAADARYHAEYEQINALAVRCYNGYNCRDNDLVDYFDGLADAYARDFEIRSATSAANASYVEAVGIAGAAEARERAARYRRFANRMRGLDGGDSAMVQRRNELVYEVIAENRGQRALHDRATAAHVAARRAALDALGRAGRTLSTAAGRLTDDPDPALPGQADVVRPDDVESEPAGDIAGGMRAVIAGWMRAVNAAVAEAERAAAETEQAAAGSGSWWSRVTACLGAHERGQRAINRVQSLTTGGRRPSFALFEGGYHTWRGLRARLDDADQRAADACAGIERERP